jgi:predicted MFS family arabinose efflux permease
MTAALRLKAGLFQPGPIAFATLFAIECLARATLTVVLPVEALRVLGDARDVSFLFSTAILAVLVLSQGIPLIVRRLGPGWTYVLAAALMLLVPLSLAASSATGIAAAVMLRSLAVSFGGNALQILIMAHIERRELTRMEPLRVAFAAGVWCVAPSVGIRLYEQPGPWASYALAMAAAVALVVYLAVLRPAVPGMAAAHVRFTPWRNLRRFFAQRRLCLAYVLNVAREQWWITFFVYVPIYAVTAGLGAGEGGFMVSAGAVLLFLTPLFGRTARRIGVRRLVVPGFVVAGISLIAAAALTAWPLAFAACIVVSAVAAVALDSVLMVTFQRAVRSRERPEMTTVFITYRDIAQLSATALFALLLSFFGLWSVFAATGAWLMACAWLSRWIPRGM